MNPIQSLRLLKQISIDYYTSAHTAHQRGAYIGYVNAFTPVELLYAMDVIPVYPENHAVILGARRMAVEASTAAEKMGYTRDLCSHALCDLGAIQTGKSPTMGLPRPDFLLASNSQCGTMTKWFERLSRHYQCPMILIDVPHSGKGERDEAAEKYIRDQLTRLLSFVEDLTGKKLDPDRLDETISLSQEASTLWGEILELAARSDPGS